MTLPLLELVGNIIEKGKFEKSKISDQKLSVNLEKLFKLHKQQNDQFSARLVYSAIVDLARIGKSELANNFALKFEKEIGHDML